MFHSLLIYVLTRIIENDSQFQLYGCEPNCQLLLTKIFSILFPGVQHTHLLSTDILVTISKI